MSRAFDAASAEWEATWTGGPPDGPRDEDEGGPDDTADTVDMWEADDA